MEFKEYQEKAHETNQYPKEKMLECLALGLCSEAGEVAGKIKKMYRGDPADTDNIWHLLSEVGDVLWYISEIATVCGIDLSAVAEMNLYKLQDRKNREKIKGDGDKR